MSDELNERLAAIESLLMHLQQDVEAMSSVLQSQTRDAAKLRQDLSKLSSRIESMETEQEPGSLKDEKPPHY